MQAAGEGTLVLLLAVALLLALALAGLIWWRSRGAAQEGEAARSQLAQQAARLELAEAEAKRLEAREGAYREQQDEVARLKSGLAGKDAQLSERTDQLSMLKQSLEQSNALLEELRSEGNKSRQELARLREAQAQAERQADEKLKLLQEARERMTQEFKLLSSEILSKQGDSFAKQNEEKLTGLLDPLRRRINEFQTSLEGVQRESAKERAGLGQQIKSLAELGTRMNEEARGLTRALKGKSQTQGAWGEMLLATVLQSSGLREGEEFSTQVSHTDESGARLRPDVIVHLPNGERIVVDAKVSLTAYQDFINGESEEERALALAAHVRSLREHLRGLSGKGYQTIGGDGPEFVIMFLPLEDALTAALQLNRDLLNEALRQNIVLTTPTTLMAVLKTVHSLWSIDRRTQNVEEIAKRGGLLYDKFVGFVDDMEKLGQRMDQARSSYDDALGKLKLGRGNLIGQAEQLRSLGAKTKKQLPQEVLEEEEGGPLLTVVGNDDDKGSAS